MEYTFIKKIKGFKELEQFGLNILQESLSNFLSCDVQIFTDPLTELKKHNINILENPNRGFYPIDDNLVIIIGRILDNKNLISSLGLRISKQGISKSARFLTILEGAITNSLTCDYVGSFKNCKYLLGDELILHSIVNYFSKGGYDYRHIRHLINFFNKMRTTSFEGRFFSTGLILTRSHYAYNKKGEGNRFGETFPLKKNISLANTNQINRRFWYLIDGKRSFLIANKSLVLTQLFVINQEYQNATYIDSHTLAKSLKGGDLLFKLENEKHFSIINSDNIEISFTENQWKFRDYNYIRLVFLDHFKGDEELIEILLFFIIYCSKNSISSIIWLPSNIDKIDKIVKANTKNRLIKDPFSIKNKAFTNHILRYLSSDGATIIDKEGFLQYFGCIVDISKIKISGLKGTGETAASALASNGISIKISQDGTIKVFNKKNAKPIII
jgi:hypothetical protein